MTLPPKAQNYYSQISKDVPKLGDLKKMGKEIKKDHDLAMELWSTEEYYPRLLAILIMDKNLLTQEVMAQLATDINTHDFDQHNQLADWLLATQLMKSKKTNEKNLEKAEPEVQWAMNFLAGQIGVHEVAYRSQCIALGERVGLYKGDPVARGCTPNYLPEFIRIEAAKRGI